MINRLKLDDRDLLSFKMGLKCFKAANGIRTFDACKLYVVHFKSKTSMKLINLISLIG